jgi:uncharacterized protein
MELVLRGRDGRVVCDPCVVADNPFARARGLALRARLAPDEGLYLATSSIHTHFMRFPIDALFLDKELCVVDIEENMRPWRVAVRRGAHAVVEIAAGEAARRNVGVGDELVLVPRENGSGPSRNGSDAARDDVHIALVADDRRFVRVARFLLGRHGFRLQEFGDVAALLAGADGKRPLIVLLDGSASMTSAARAVHAIEALGADISVIVVADDESAPKSLTVVPKWGAFEDIVRAVDRSYYSLAHAHELA